MSYEYRVHSQIVKAPVLLWALLLPWTCLPTSMRAEARTVDLELVLAVDVSGSMSRTELLLQRHGYIAALRSEDIPSALAIRGAVALAYMEWAGANEQRIVVPWTMVSSAADADRFADGLAASPLYPSFKSPPWGSGTSLSRALTFAAALFSAGTEANRTIDISGNGPNDSGGSLALARERLISKGITINGLPIVRPGRGPDFPLSVYYEDCVIGGPGAFAITVDDPSLFAHTIRRKLVLEIASAGLIIPATFVSAGPPRVDCDPLIGPAGK